MGPRALELVLVDCRLALALLVGRALELVLVDCRLALALLVRVRELPGGFLSVSSKLSVLSVCRSCRNIGRALTLAGSVRGAAAVGGRSMMGCMLDMSV